MQARRLVRGGADDRATIFEHAKRGQQWHDDAEYARAPPAAPFEAAPERNVGSETQPGAHDSRILQQLTTRHAYLSALVFGFLSRPF